MLLLSETPQGYRLFRISDSSLENADAKTVRAACESSQSLFALAHEKRFKDLKTGVQEAFKLQEGVAGSVLTKFLKKHVKSEALGVMDKNLATNLSAELKISVKCDSAVQELFRALKTEIDQLFPEANDVNLAVSYAHSLTRFKIKYSPDKIDTMVIHAVGLLDELDVELNGYAMRLKEWYGFHFPELVNKVETNMAYAKVVLKGGLRSNYQLIDTFTDCDISESTSDEIKALADISMGSELTENDLLCMQEIARRVVELTDYRVELLEYLKNRMNLLAPNLTVLLGEVLAAKLLAHCGSLSSLAKLPASTVQILGAEKALFRALKTKSPTPKYGLIYHAKAVTQSVSDIKGKMSRVLANKISLCARSDAYSEQTSNSFGIANKEHCERRLGILTELLANGQLKRNKRLLSVNKNKQPNPKRAQLSTEERRARFN